FKQRGNRSADSLLFARTVARELDLKPGTRGHGASSVVARASRLKHFISFAGFPSNLLTLPHRFRTIPPYEPSLSLASPGQARQLHGHHLQGRPQEKWPRVPGVQARVL